jgi:hypothetical protein
MAHNPANAESAMNQRNVIASFRDYDDANSAASELSRSGFGDVQIRVLPPRTTYGRYRNQQIVVSAIVNNTHATAAENILALNGGAIDLHEDANWGGSRWDDRRGGFRPERHERHFGKRKHHRRSWMEELPWGTIAGATVALLSGYAFLRGSILLNETQTEDYPPGDYRRNSRSFRSATNNPSYPDGGRFRRSAPTRSLGRAEQLADEADLAWGDHGSDDTAPLYDRPAGSGSFQTGAPVRAPSNQGLGSGQNATSGEAGTLQVGIGSGSSMTQGLGRTAGSGGSFGAGSGVAQAAAHGRDQAGTAATRFDNDEARAKMKVGD